nr:glutamate receptor ionotropic, delta-1-like [Rhipicephalus microplus]
MTIMPLIQTYHRHAVGEYSPAIIYVPFGILSASDSSTSNVFGYILTFDWKVWALLLSAIPILALLISLSEFAVHRRPWKTMPQDVHQWGWELFGNLLYESSPRATSQTSGRIVMTSWLLAVLVIANSFAGHLKSSMAIKNEPTQVDSVEDVVDRPNLRPFIWKGSYYEALISTSPSPRMKKLWRMVVRKNGSMPGNIMYMDKNMREVIQRRAVFMVDHNSQRFHMAAFCRRESTASFHFGREIIEEHRLSFLMSRSMCRDLHHRIYKRVTWLYESGLVSKWMADELGDWQRCVRRTGEHVAEDLTIEDTMATFLLWGIVMCAAAAALFIETLRRPSVDRTSPEIPFQRRAKMRRGGHWFWIRAAKFHQYHSPPTSAESKTQHASQ